MGNRAVELIQKLYLPQVQRRECIQHVYILHVGFYYYYYYYYYYLFFYY